MTRSRGGFTLLDWVLVLAGVALLLVPITVVFWPKARMLANSNNPGAFLKQLARHEAQWKQGDYDGNGMLDYWTRDVAGFHCVHDPAGSISAGCSSRASPFRFRSAARFRIRCPTRWLRG